MKTKLILGAAVLALAACGSSDDKTAGNGSAAATDGGSAAATGGGSSASGVSLEPGLWEMKTEVVSVSAEGLPPGAAESMKAQAGGTTRNCMSAEDAKGPKADMFAKGQPGNCKSEGFSWSGGRIQGKTTCSGGPAGGKAVVTMDGTYSGQAMDMTLKSETDVAGHAIKSEMRISGKRVGECTADDAKEG